MGNLKKQELCPSVGTATKEFPMRMTIFASFAISMLLLMTKPAIAQLPPGDYKQTCRDMRSNGSQLTARCQRVDGGWRNTSINFRSCNGPIANDDGNLRCSQGGRGYGYNRPGWQGGLPPGDYKRTCQNMRMNGDRLNATCQKRDGGWNDTSLRNVYNCNTRVVNDDGNLRCQR